MRVGAENPSRRAGAVALAWLIAVWFVALPAHALDDPSLSYWTLETAHFRVTYAEPLEPVARRVAVLCESIHGRVSDTMQFTPGEKTEVILTDDTDSANGSASPVPYNHIRLFVTAPGDISTLGDYDDWLLGLITHEYTHTLHTGNISGIPSVANAVLGRTLAPNAAQPRWVIEGLAVVLESEHSSGGRIRSSLFDAYIRADVLENNFARLDQISGGAQRWPYGTMFYLYGSRFLRWVTDVYGPNTMPAVSADYGAATVPFGINRAIRRVTGRTYEQLYGAWHEHLKSHYGEQVKKIDQVGRREGTRITHHGRNVLYPRFVPKALRKVSDQEEIVYYRSDQTERSGLYRFALGKVGDGSPRAESHWVRTNADSGGTFTPEGGLVFASVESWNNLYSRHDIFEVAKGETSTFGTEDTRVRRTVGLRAAEPDVSPDGRHVAFTVNSRGTTRLALVSRSAEGTFGAPKVVLEGRAFDQVYTPRFSPDGRKIAVSMWQAGGLRDIRVLDIASGAVLDVTHDRALDLQPTWSADGKTLYFSSDRTGVFNVYAYDVASKKLMMVTNVTNAALAPAVNADGSKLVYTGITSAGFDLFAMALDPTRFLEAPPAPTDRPAPYAEPPNVPMEKERYNPLRTLAPKTWSISLGQGYFGSFAVTFSTGGSDLVGHHGVSASVVFDPDAPEPRGSVSYSYSGLPVTMGIDFSRSVVPRSSGYQIGNREVPFNETRSSISSTLSLPILRSYVDQVIGFTYSGSVIHSSLPIPDRINPDDPVTRKPDEGFLSQVRLSYGLSTTEGGVDAAGSKRGFSFRVGTSIADEGLGSDSSLYAFDFGTSGYIPMPWPGEQTLALRASGAVAGGSYARRGLYFVGGYDLENTDFLDQVLFGTYDGAFLLRGYAPGSYSGSEFVMTSMEYRAPIWTPNWGPSTLPIFWRRLDAAAFVDWGGAFNELHLERTRIFSGGDFLHVPGMHASVGLELWFALTLASRIDSNFKLGYAYGFSEEAVENGQLYFLGSSAF